MTFAARMVRDVRSARRHAVEIDGTLRDPDWRPFDVTVEDLSAQGFRIPAVVDLPVGSAISLGLPGVGPRSATVVRATGDAYGCQFDDQLAADELGSAAVGRFPRAVRLALLGGMATVSWAAILGVRALIG